MFEGIDVGIRMIFHVSFMCSGRGADRYSNHIMYCVLHLQVIAGGDNEI